MNAEETMATYVIGGLIIVYGIYKLIRCLRNRRKGQEGIQYQELQKLVATALSKKKVYQVAYGHREDIRHTGTYTWAVCFHYALAFCGNCLWIGSLSFAKKTNAMFLNSPMERVYPEEMEKMIVHTTGKKGMLDLRRV